MAAIVVVSLVWSAIAMKAMQLTVPAAQNAEFQVQQADFSR